MMPGIPFHIRKALLFLFAGTFLFLSCSDVRQQEQGFTGHSFQERLADGDSLLEAGLFVDAFRIFDTLARAYPDSTQLSMRLVQVYMAVGLVGRADELLRQMMEHDTSNREPGYWAGILSLSAIARGDTLQLDQLTESLRALASEAFPDVYKTAAFNEVFLRDFEQAIRDYQRWVSIEKPEAPPLNLGFLYMKEGREDEGLQILKAAEVEAYKAAASSPGDWEPRFELAEIASMRGDTADALQHLQQALDRGLDKEWWLMMEKGPGAIPDPVFETILHTEGYHKLMDPVFQNRAGMRRAIEEEIDSK